MDKDVLLYNYFSNQLSNEQQLAFDTLLETDADFKSQFEFEKNLKRAIKNKENKDLKAKLISFESNIKEEPIGSSSRGGFKNWSIAASIALLIGLGYVGYNSMGANYSNLYDTNFQEYPNTVFAITRSDVEESLERSAFVAYESRNYQDAITNFEKIQTPERYLDFYKGQCYLGLGDTTKAIELFKKVKREKREFSAEANWYLALTYLKGKNKVEALSVLQQHVKEYDYNKEKAIALLSKLN